MPRLIKSTDPSVVALLLVRMAMQEAVENKGANNKHGEDVLIQI